MKVTKLIINGEEQNLTGVPYTAGSGINIDSNNEISNTLPGAIVSATAPSSPTEGMVWYDTTNDVLKTYDGTNWNIVGDDAADINTKTFFISGTVEEKKSKLGQAIQYYLNGKNPILSLGNTTYTLRDVVVGDFELGTNDVYTFSSTIKSENGKFWEIVVDVLVTAQGHGSTVSSFTDTKHSAGAVVSGAAPSNPAQGDMWYDTTNDVLKIYDGTNWNITGKEYEAGDGIAIGERHKDTQGPCPDGFHVPTYGEMATLHEWLSFHLGLDDLSPSLQEYLYLPSPGCLRGTDGVYVADEFGGTGQDFFYITATQSGANNAIYFLGETHSKTMAGAIRPFKDVPVVPDSTWTFTRDAEQYSGIAGTGVYYNPTLGLISLSKDMVNWITIPDKNLGATTVYDFGDTLSEANTGKFFQRGNNYGFPFTGAVTTSATQVDASGYGPGNYYSSDTFITGSNDWSSVENGNLWGGATDGIRIDENGNVIYNTGVLSVNNQAGAVTVSEFTPGGTATTGYVVTKTANGYEWSAPSGGDVVVSSQPNNILTSGMKIWAGLESDYGNLGTYDQNTLYLTIE